MKKLIVVLAAGLLVACLPSGAQKLSFSTDLLGCAFLGTLNAEVSVAVTRKWSVLASARYNPFTFRKDDPDADYLGPYTGNYSVTNACARAAEIFRLPTCNKVFPRDIKSSRPCLNYFISRCSAPCAGKISQEEYEESLKSAVDFLKNPDASAVRELRAEMEEASENLDFEKEA